MTIPMTPAEPEKKPLIMRWVTDHPDRILIGLTVFTVGLALLFLALWVVTNLLWAAEDAELRLIEKTNSETGAVVRVDYPAVVLANSQPVTFTFTVRNVTDTVTVAVPILDSVRQVVTAASEVAPLTMTLPITPITGNAGVATIAFVNAKIDRGIRSWTCMNVSVSAPVSLTVPVCFNVEGTWGLAARSFISIAVTDKSPLIVLIVTFITGTGALLPGLLRQQADRNADRRKKEEERRVQQQEAAMQRRKDKAAQAVRFFRGHLVKQELEAAQGDLRELEDPALVNFAAVELPLMRSLVQLATAPDDADLIELVKQTAIWPNECAAAYLMAYQRLHHINPSVLREAKNFVPAGFVSDETLRADLQKAAQSFPEVQRLIWPVVRNLAVPVSDNPFQHGLADDDRAALFGVPSNDRRPAYWPGHTVSGAVRNSDRPQVVFGEHGSGRTAMSLALGKYMIGQSIRLSLYLPGQPTNDGISSGYARLLLDFVQAYPTHLSKLTHLIGVSWRVF